MKTAGSALRFYRELIAECIPLFVAAGLAAALCSAASLTGSGYLAKVSDGLYSLVIPVMAGYKAGKKCGGDAGGFAGALAASAVVMPGAVSAFTASVLAGGCSGYLYRKGMERLEKVMPSGFEMLIRNVYLAAAGLAGGFLAYLIFLPITIQAGRLLAGGIAVLADTGLLPWSGVLVEPLKILFLNNWLNHGLLLPLGMEQVQAAGGSLLFLLEENPGPGFGILAAFALSQRNEKKETASALVIQMLGGIHEVYFPYVLTDLRLLAAAVAGGVAGNYFFMLTGCRLHGPASPGSLITILLMSEPGQWAALTAGILVSSAVSFGFAMLILRHPVRMPKQAPEQTEGQPPSQMTEPPAEQSAEQAAERMLKQSPEQPEEKKDAGNMKVYFVCDAGMGSSAMAGSLFRKKLREKGIEGVEVFHVSADRIPEDADVLVCQKSFAVMLPDTGHPCFTVDNLIDMSGYEALLDYLEGR